MDTDSAEDEDFIARWLQEKQGDSTLNQAMVALLSEKHASGTCTDDGLLKALIEIADSSEVADVIR